eukprot:COSAG02_NODE_1366_length_13032_cov_721.428207_3_plen_85_part_00
MRLAAHLCGPALNQVLRGDTSFVEELAAKGFGRVQLNATAVRAAGSPLIRADAWPALSGSAGWCDTQGVVVRVALCADQRSRGW